MRFNPAYVCGTYAEGITNMVSLKSSRFKFMVGIAALQEIATFYEIEEGKRNLLYRGQNQDMPSVRTCLRSSAMEWRESALYV